VLVLPALRAVLVLPALRAVLVLRALRAVLVLRALRAVLVLRALRAVLVLRALRGGRRFVRAGRVDQGHSHRSRPNARGSIAKPHAFALDRREGRRVGAGVSC
jgi:hypothetical protein